MKTAKASIAVLILHLIIVSSVAAKYIYERVTCPRVWTRTAAYDPALLMRGRYLSLQLTVDGCGSALPSAKDARYPSNVHGAPTSPVFNVNSPPAAWFQAKLGVSENKLTAIRIPDSASTTAAQTVTSPPGAPCDQMRLAEPVDFYIAEHAADPTFLKGGQELWIEVTVPPQGPPRPLQLALKDNGVWKPFAFQ